jgi:hypothetical protein
MHKTLGSILNTSKKKKNTSKRPGMLAYTCNPSKRLRQEETSLSP